MSFILVDDNENDDDTKQHSCFPNNKTIKCFMKRSSRVALRPLNVQRSKKTKMDEKSKEKLELQVCILM